ncbi:MAG: hypothetical protein Q9208_002414 [Pyrenodesmia sp. 3 TL-2023]
MPPTRCSTTPAGPLRKFTFRHASIRLPNYLVLAPDWPLADLASKTPAGLLASLLALNPDAAWQAFTPLCLAAIYGRLLGDHGTLKERVLLKLMFKHSIDIQAHHASLVAWYPRGLVPDLANYCHAIQIPLEHALNAAPAKPLPRELFDGLLEKIVSATAEAPGIVSETERDGSKSPHVVVKFETPEPNPTDSLLGVGALPLFPASLDAASPTPPPAASSSSTLAPSPSSPPPLPTPEPTPPAAAHHIIEPPSSSSVQTTPEPMTRKRGRGLGSLVKVKEEEGCVRVKQEGEGAGEDGDGDVEMVVVKRRKCVGGGGRG